jgi:putative membrane protein
VESKRRSSSKGPAIADRRLSAAIGVVDNHRREPRRRGSHVISKSLIVAAFFGFLLVVFLIIESGAAEVASAMLVLGWRLAPIALFHLAPLSFDTLAWRQLFPVSSRPRFLRLLGLRWIRESINSLLPVAGVGGDLAGARLVHKTGVPGAEAASSVVVDITIGAAAQLLFVLAGVAALLVRSNADGASEVARGALIGVGVFAAGIAGFVLVQHNSMFSLFARLARRVAPRERLSEFEGRASAVDGAVTAIYRNRLAFIRANALRFAGCVAGAGEIWLVMYFLSKPLTLIDALILESLSSGVRAAAFMVPGALGAQESGIVVFGALFGLPADTALAISLSKRVRELALGVPGLFAWQWAEGRHLFRPRKDPAGRAPHDLGSI